MSGRISLTRVIALHWYGFRQIFDVDDNVLISGAFGTGKSALLDLVQYVLLGEHWRANRAAAGNARGRDLVGYCLGDTNQTRDGRRHFLRSSGVTVAALEFTRPGDRKGGGPARETWGVRLEYSSPDAAPKQTYFSVPERLEFAALAPDGKNLLAEDAFRAWVRREFGNECLFPRQRDYLEEMAAPRHLNFDPLAFHRTFPKAIAFEPEENVGKFIREFILEESPLDVRDVRLALRAYDDTRRRLEKQEDEAAFLKRIAVQHEIHQASRREAAVLQHVESDLKLIQAGERRDKNAAELARLEASHAADLLRLDAARREVESVNNVLAEVRFEIGRDSAAVEIARLESRKAELQRKVAALGEARRATHKRLDDRHYRWCEWLKHAAALPLEGLKAAVVVDDAALAALRSGADAERLTAMQQLAGRFNTVWNDVQNLVRPLQEEIRGAAQRLEHLAEDLENLSRGQAPGAFPLFHALRHRLGARVDQLARLIEVKPEAERWWPALEVFLGRNRWALVVAEPADYREALELLRKTPPGREPESLLNPSEVRALRPVVRQGSLLDKVEVLSEAARPWVEQLLGDVLCVDTVEELERTDAGRAITPDGVYKQAPLRRRIRPAVAVELTLGREGLERMRSAKQREQVEVRARRDALQRRWDDVSAWLDTGRKGGLADPTLPDRAAELPQLPGLESDLGGVRETLQLMMTPEREARQKRLKELDDRKTALDREVGGLLNAEQEFNLRTRPIRDALEAVDEEIRAARHAAERSRAELSLRFTGILDAELNERRDAVRARHPKWGDCAEALAQSIRAAGERAAAARAQRQSEREKLAAARDARGALRHPEYAQEFPVEDESNEAWSSRLRVLEAIELDKSRQLAQDRKRDWERRLEENVLNELNRRITEAEGTVHLLNRYLGQPVGKFRYRIVQQRDTAGYGPLWRLLDSGLEPTDPLSAALQEGDVKAAKEELMQAVDAPEKGDDRARRLLDYRNYHHYDLVMVPSDRPDAPPISLGRSGRNLSGGENQAPFFISMLAAFRRVYDRGDRSSARSQQLGLVVMDEAFSKLSGDGIEDCLALAKSFQLQLVMAFPPERLGVMIPHAQTVVMCLKETHRDAEGYVTRIDNIPLLTTMAEAMEALG